MYRIGKSIDIDFAHQVHGHQGACINIHGHTWKFEVILSSQSLDQDNMVADFSLLKKAVLQPAHDLLDHGFAIYEETLATMEHSLAEVGRVMVGTRDPARKPLPPKGWCALGKPPLNGAKDICIGGLKVVSFPFPPTSETLARWLFIMARYELHNAHCGAQVDRVRVYETLHPVQAWAEYSDSSI